MNRMIGVMKMHSKDKWSWFLIPWLILIANFVVTLAVGFFTGGKTPIYTGGIGSFYIAMLIIGIVVLVQMFPFALGLSVRRTDFFLGTVGMTFIVSVGAAVVLYILAQVEQWTGAWSINLHFFHLPYLNDGSAFEQLFIYFMLMWNMVFGGFTISSVYRRFGRNGMFIFFIAVFLVGSVVAFLCTYYKWWLDIFYWLSDHTAFTLAMWTIPLVLIYMLVSYLLLRKATV